MTDETALRASLEALKPQAMEAAAEVVRLQTEAALAKQRSEQLNRIVEGLENLLRFYADPPGSMAEVVAPGALLRGELEQREAEQRRAPREPRGAAPIKRVRSTELVIDIVNSAARAITRGEVLDLMHEYGHTSAMKDPRNSVNTALYRAVKDGRIRRMDAETYIALDQRVVDAEASDSAPTQALEVENA
jgi:hypothetical protein